MFVPATRVFLWKVFLVTFFINSLVGINIECICEADCRSSQVCHVVNLSVTSKNSKVTTVNGKSEAFGVKYLRFFSLVINFMPQGIELFFPKIEVLELASSHLKSIEQSDLEPFAGLKELDLHNNDLVVLNEGLFDFNHDLRRISFDGNKDLKFIDENILKLLKKLEYASFHKCHCIDYQANNRKNIYSQRILEAELRKRCHSPKSVKQIFCSEEIQILNDRISDVESQLAEQTLSLNHAHASLASHNGNLDLATKSLLSTSKQLKSCMAASNMEFMMDSENVEEIDLICKDDDGDESCSAVNFKVETKGSIIRDVKSISSESVDTDKVKKLFIVRQLTLFLPTNIADIFHNLQELFVNSSGLFEIDSKMFQNLTQLKCLTLTRNKFFEIPADAFDSLPNLVELDLSMNNIESLEDDVFKALSKVEVLNLNYNHLTIIDVNLFENLKSLKQLMIQSNKLKYISTNLFADMAQLETVDLSNNICINVSCPKETLRFVEKEIIDNCVAPIELKCSFADPLVCDAQKLIIEHPKTRVSKVNNEEFKINITVFKVINQTVKFFPHKVSEALPNLLKIIIERSHLTTLGKHDFEGLLVLKSIIILHNNLSSIHEEVFDFVPNLEYLDLSFNNIHTLPSRIFKRLTNLTTAILSNNQIRKITADILPQQNNIQEFRANNNQLEFIESKILRFLKKANVIDFSENVCITLMFGTNGPNKRTLAELSGEITINCSHDD